MWIEGMKPQNTDIHWRAKERKAAWNYRMKWKVRADGEIGSHSKRSAALVSRSLGLKFGDVLDPSLLRTVSKGGRPTRRINGYSSL